MASTRVWTLGISPRAECSRGQTCQDLRQNQILPVSRLRPTDTEHKRRTICVATCGFDERSDVSVFMGQRTLHRTRKPRTSYGRTQTERRTHDRTLVVTCGVAEPNGVPAPMGQRTLYKDSWFDLAFMKVFAAKMEQFIDGGRGVKDIRGYDDFVETSRRVMRGRNPEQQREVVGRVLLSLLPPNAPATFRKLFPPTKLSCELNAMITVPFFQWLVGPAQLKKVEVNGVEQWSGVQITKCRYLESSGCVGMCVNMCKLPTQDFFTDQFGLPLTMTPNYEDMSCEMVFGQMPPPLEEDPALQQQPCYKELCPMAKPAEPRCPTLVAAKSS